jgi:hypothetical protein
LASVVIVWPSIVTDLPAPEEVEVPEPPEEVELPVAAAVELPVPDEPLVVAAEPPPEDDEPHAASAAAAITAVVAVASPARVGRHWRDRAEMGPSGRCGCMRM